jgi:hypothetical protein
MREAIIKSPFHHEIQRKFGSFTVPLLVAMYTSEQTEVREKSLEFSAYFWTDEKIWSAVPYLLDRILDSNVRDNERRLASRAFNMLGERAVPPLLEALASAPPKAKVYIAAALENIGHHVGDRAKAAISPLTELLDHPVLEVVGAAFDALEKIAKNKLPTSAYIKSLRTGKNAYTGCLIRHLEKMDPLPISELELGLRETDKHVRAGMLETLSYLAERTSALPAEMRERVREYQKQSMDGASA